MKRQPAQIGKIVLWCLGIAVASGGGWWIAGQFSSRENESVSWALQVAKNRERARKAGYTSVTWEVPTVDPAKNAATEWIRIDAIIRANEPEGTLPTVGELVRLANPRTRAKSDRKKTLALWQKYRVFLPEARRAVQMPLCQFPYRTDGTSIIEGMHAAALIGCIALVSAEQEQEQRHWQRAIPPLVMALQIARQLQAQQSFTSFRIGLRLEQVTLRVIRDGLCTRDLEARREWIRAFAGQESTFLRTFLAEKPPLTQLRGLLAHDLRLLYELVHEVRTKKYKPGKDLFEESIPILRYLNRLDFYFDTHLGGDAWESIETWRVAGLETRWRGCKTTDRPYHLWKVTENWDQQVIRANKTIPRWLQIDEWADVPLNRIYRDVDRALTQAVWKEVTGKQEISVPEDPFAEAPRIPLHRRVLPDGTVVWYSIGSDGKDGGGDFTTDTVARILAPGKK